MQSIHYLDFSASQTSVVGRKLHDMYYRRGELLKLRDLFPAATGYPHNGGEHTLSMRGTKEDLVAWVELFEEITKIDLKEIKAAIIRCKGKTTCHYISPELFRTHHPI